MTDVKHLPPDRSKTTLVLSHKSDLDGVASAVLLKHILESMGEIPEVFFADYADAEQILKDEAPDRKAVWIADISLRDGTLIEKSLAQYDEQSLYIFDHHSSSRPTLKTWERRKRATLKFDDNGQHCTADLAYQYGLELFRHDDALLVAYIDKFKDLVSATHSIDLWIRTDKRGDSVSDVIAVLGAVKVFDLLVEDVLRINLELFTEEMNQAFITCEVMRKESMALAQNTAFCTTYADIDNPDYTGTLQIITAVCKGFESQVGEMFYLWSVTPKIVVLLNPDDNTMSFRIAEHSIVTTNVRANRVAARFGGGGHPMASGSPMPNDLRPLDTAGLAERVKCVIESLYKTGV